MSCLSSFSRSLACILFGWLLATPASAVPALLNHQGRIAVNGVNFDGTGQFKFALVNGAGTTTFWSNNGTSVGGSEPTAAVPLVVTRGLYAVLLGDTTLPNMIAVPTSIFDNNDVRLRVWFNDGVTGSQRIIPDQRFASAPYALAAEKAAVATTVANGSITAEKIAPGAVTNANLGNASLTVTAGTGLSGGGVVALGGSVSLQNAGVTALTGGGGISVSSGTGAITLGSNATSANTPGTLIQRNASGNFSAGTITGNLAGNATTATNAVSFTGTLGGDVTGTQSATSVSTVGGLAAANVAAGATLANGSTAANLPNAVVRRDTNGNFAAGTITANLAGNATNAASFTGPLGGDVTGTQSATSVSTVGGLAAANVAAGAALANGSTAANLPNAVVRRDTNGNFSAGTITATFVGDGSALTGITSNQTNIRLTNILAPPAKPVVAWGDNGGGQTAAPPLADVAQVAAGSEQSLALLDSGTVVAWGTGPAVPMNLTSVTHIAAGPMHSLARRTNGTVTAWGDNTFGQSTVPGGLNDAAFVAAGEKHSVALRAGGTVIAWGDNSFGQTTIPGGLSGVVAVAAGYDHTVALLGNGTVVAWGRNDVGQTTVPGALSGVTAIGAGAYHSLAVKSDGTVVAWGWDTGGQSSVPPGLTGVSKVAGGYSFSLALKTDGTLVAWGDNSDEQTTIPAGATQITAIAAGTAHALALRADLLPAQVVRLDQDNALAGNLGIQRIAAVNALEVEGQASKTTAGNWLANSDRRIKTEVQPVTSALEKLDRIRPVDFRYTQEYRASHPGIEDRRYLNIIAQEFAEVFPEHVKSSGETLADGSPILQVDTYPLTIYSVAAVQELHRENIALKQKLADQEMRLRKLEAALSK